MRLRYYSEKEQHDRCMKQQYAFRELEVVWSGEDRGLQRPRGVALPSSWLKQVLQLPLCPRQLSQALLPAVSGRGLVCGKGGSQDGGGAGGFWKKLTGLLGKESGDDVVENRLYTRNKL